MQAVATWQHWSIIDELYERYHKFLGEYQYITFTLRHAWAVHLSSVTSVHPTQRA